MSRPEQGRGPHTHSSAPIGLARGEALLALLVFASFAVVFTWPTAAQLGELNLLAVSSPFDALIYRWNFAAFSRSLAELSSPLYSDALYFPETVPLALYTPTHLYSLFSMPIQLAISGERGLHVAFHLCVLGSFTFAGFGAYWLGRHQGLTPGGALIAGVTFAFCAARVTNLARLNVLGSEFIPFAMLGLLLSIERSGWRGPLLLAASCTALAYNSASQAATTAIGLLVLAPFGLRARTAGWAQRLGLAGGIALLATAPLAPSVIEALGWSETWAMPAAARVSFSLDLLALVWPNAHDLFLGGLLPSRPTNVLEQNFSFFPGISVLGLFIAGLLCGMQLPRRAAWIALAVAGALLALGPEAKLLESPTGVSLPWAWFEAVLPPLQITRVPSRFVVLFSLSLALASGAALDAVARRFELKAAAGAAVAGVIAAVIALDSVEGLPLPNARPFEPSLSGLAEHFATRDAGASPDGAVLDLPYDGYYTRRLAMYHQVGHGRPILFADYERASRRNREHFASSALFQLLVNRDLGPAALDGELARLDLAEERRHLRDLGVAAVVLHHGFFESVVGPGEPWVPSLVERGRVMRARLGDADFADIDAGSYRAWVLDL